MRSLQPRSLKVMGRCVCYKNLMASLHLLKILFVSLPTAGSLPWQVGEKAQEGWSCLSTFPVSVLSNSFSAECCWRRYSNVYWLPSSASTSAFATVQAAPNYHFSYSFLCGRSQFFCTPPGSDPSTSNTRIWRTAIYFFWSGWGLQLNPRHLITLMCLCLIIASSKYTQPRDVAGICFPLGIVLLLTEWPCLDRNKVPLNFLGYWLWPTLYFWIPKPWTQSRNPAQTFHLLGSLTLRSLICVGSKSFSCCPPCASFWKLYHCVSGYFQNLRPPRDEAKKRQWSATRTGLNS